MRVYQQTSRYEWWTNNALKAIHQIAFLLLVKSKSAADRQMHMQKWVSTHPHTRRRSAQRVHIRGIPITNPDWDFTQKRSQKKNLLWPTFFLLGGRIRTRIFGTLDPIQHWNNTASQLTRYKGVTDARRTQETHFLRLSYSISNRERFEQQGARDRPASWGFFFFFSYCWCFSLLVYFFCWVEVNFLFFFLFFLWVFMFFVI